MKNINKILLLAPLALCLTSCIDPNEVYEQDAYNNPIFTENYYRIYPKEIRPIDSENDSNNITIDNVNHKEIKLGASQFVTRYEDAVRFDNDITKLEYDFDESTGTDYDIKGYGPEKKLAGIDDQFKYGYISKLFDGRLFCNGNFQLSRVQMDERGFGVLFQKELINKDYFACNFKMAANDAEKKIIVPNHGSNPEDAEQYDSDITLKVTFYLRDGNTYTPQVVSMDIDDVPTNRFESNSNSSYVFCAFSLKDIDLTRCCGFSMSYELRYNAFIEKTKVEHPDTRLDHAIMLYEVFLPNSTWR